MSSSRGRMCAWAANAELISCSARLVITRRRDEGRYADSSARTVNRFRRSSILPHSSKASRTRTRGVLKLCDENGPTSSFRNCHLIGASLILGNWSMIEDMFLPMVVWWLRASWYAVVVITVDGLLRSATSRLKKRKAPNSPVSRSRLAMVDARVLLPDPASPCNQSTRSVLPTFDAQSSMNSMTSIRVPARHCV